MCLGSYAAVNEGVWVLVATVGTRCLLWMGCSREPGLERALEMLCSSEASAPYSTRGGGPGSEIPPENAAARGQAAKCPGPLAYPY